MRSTTYFMIACLTVIGAGCAKKKAAATPPSPAPAPQVARNTAPAPIPAQTTPTSQSAVSQSPERLAPASATLSFSDVITSRLKDVHFDYDRSTIGESDGSVLASDAKTLSSTFRDFPAGKVLVEGDCDERGSAEYNMALGDERARATRDYLKSLGVPPARIDIVSYGKEHPVCTEDTGLCWTQNRRAHFRAE